MPELMNPKMSHSTITPLDDIVLLTEKAAEEVKKIRTDNNIPEAYGLRLTVQGGSTTGLSYALAFDEVPGEKDHVLESCGVRLFIDQKSMFYLSGTVLDFSEGTNGRGFVFANPQAAR